LRDFSLDLKGRSANEYLEYALANQQGNSAEINRKNMIRSKVREYFKQRDCLCLIRPLNDEKLLSRIEEQDYDTLRPEFL
jgi:Guanylate-binding protein, N-terminal domain